MKARLIVLALICAVFAAGTAPAQESKPKKKRRLGIVQQLEKDLKESNIKKDTKEAVSETRAEMRGENDDEKAVEENAEETEKTAEENANLGFAAILADVQALQKIAKDLKAGGDEETAKKIEEVAGSIEKKVKTFRERALDRRLEVHRVSVRNTSESDDDKDKEK